MKKIQEPIHRVITSYDLSYISLALLLVCHRIFIRQRNFDSLRTEIINLYDFKDLPAEVKEAFNHGEKFESRSLDLYIDVMRLKFETLCSKL